MRRYETIFIAYADLPEEEINGLVERYSAIIKDRKGILIKAEKWGKRKLAYEIKKHARGSYVLIDFAGTAAIVTELERNLRIGDKILKFMTVKTQDTVDLQELEKEMNPSVAEEKAEPTPDIVQEAATPQEGAEVTEMQTIEAEGKEGESTPPEPASEEVKE